MIKSLFPEDTRLSELIAACSLITISFLMMFGNIENCRLLLIHRAEFWSVSFLIFGSIQLISLIFYPKLEILRCIVSAFSGWFLIWISITSYTNTIHINDIFTFWLGLANLYSFVINSVQVKRTWAN